MTTSTKQKPVASRKVGLIEASIWENTNEDGKVNYNATFTRSYFDGEVYREATGYQEIHLLVLKELTDWSFETIMKLTHMNAA